MNATEVAGISQLIKYSVKTVWEVQNTNFSFVCRTYNTKCGSLFVLCVMILAAKYSICSPRLLLMTVHNERTVKSHWTTNQVLCTVAKDYAVCVIKSQQNSQHTCFYSISSSKKYFNLTL